MRRYLAFTKLHLSIYAANRVDAAIRKRSAKEEYHAEIVGNQTDSLKDSNSKSFAYYYG